MSNSFGRSHIFINSIHCIILMKYVFEIKIKSGHTVDEYVAAWKHGSAIIQKMRGARGTRLYIKIGEPNTLLTIADWESKEARDKAMHELDNSNEETREIIHKHEKYGRFIKIGEYEETEWKVLP